MNKKILRLATASCLLSVLVLLVGCGGKAALTPQTPTGQNLNMAGNWQVSTASTVSGGPPLAIGGSISQSGNSLSGLVHIDGSNCFDRSTTVGLAGTLTGTNATLTSGSTDGQVITITATTDASADNITGTYSISGGCSNGDRGSVTGFKLSHVGGAFDAVLTSQQGANLDLTAEMTQDAPDPEGSFGISGTISGTSCVRSGTITPGAFPMNSYILGTAVSLEVATDNGTLTFSGTMDPSSGKISGTYTLSGGSCDQSGTGYLAVDPFGY